MKSGVLLWPPRVGAPTHSCVHCAHEYMNMHTLTYKKKTKSFHICMTHSWYILFLDINPKDYICYYYRYTCSFMFIVAIFTIVRK